jgi:hypothetical protein
MASPVESAFRTAVANLDALRVRWALIAVANDSEAEESATRLEVLPKLSAPVATTGHLIALKALAGRNQDLTDLASLIPAASTEDLDAAREAVRLIHARGFNREQDVAADLDKLIAELGR